MKKMSCAVLILGAFLVVPSTASALPQATLYGSTCSYVFDPLNGFDAQMFQLLTILNTLGIGGLPSDWHLADLEADMAGDGIPDWEQLGLLGATICAGDAGVIAQYNTNLGLFSAFLANIGAVFTQVSTMAGHMDTSGDNVLTWLDTPQAGLGGLTPRQVLPPANVTQIETVANGLIAAAAEVGGFVTEYGPYVGVLGGFGPWFAGMAGLSTEMLTTIQHLVDVELLGSLSEAIDALNQLAGGCALLAGSIPIPPMTAPLQAELMALAAEIQAGATALGGIHTPSFVIYGSSKAADEPFSAAGNYDGAGDTNLQVYQKVVTDPLSLTQRGEFVAGASGAWPFYPGAAGLPVAGVIGLALLTGVCALAGAFSIRKK